MTNALVGASVAEIDTPALLIDLTVLETNIATMAKLCEGKPARLRPHAKTHKSSIIAAMQIKAGAAGVCCAKLGEAEALVAEGGIQDIMITTPLVGGRKLERMTALARTTKLTVLADNEAAIEALDHAAAASGRIIDVVVEVDVGQKRCGVPPGPMAAQLAGVIARCRHLHFKGLHGYHGKLQMTAAYAERRAAVRSALTLLQESADQVRREGHVIDILTGGGSGSVAIDLELGGLNELQPGSYVFMDSSYLRIAWDDTGNPPPFESSLSILGSVISRPSRDRAVIDVGWKTASNDSGPPVPKSPDLLFEFAGDEHGVVRSRDGAALELGLDDKLELIPSHCDTTVNLHSEYTIIRDGRVQACRPIAGRGRSQ